MKLFLVFIFLIVSVWCIFSVGWAMGHQLNLCKRPSLAAALTDAIVMIVGFFFLVKAAWNSL